MARFIPLILFTVLTNAAAQILIKKGMINVGPVTLADRGLLTVGVSIASNPLVVLGLAVFVISMATHMIVLSHVDVSFAYPFISLAFIIVAIYANFAMGEHMSLARVAGIAFICLGVLFVSRS